MRITTLKGLGACAAVAAAIFGASWAANPMTQSWCLAQAPNLAGEGPGYELINLLGGEAWVTRDWTPTEYAAFTPPLSWRLWFKNDPRVAVADEARFSRSPGCPEDGQFSYMNAFGRTFVLVASPGVANVASGEVRRIEVEKHHFLRYAAGRTVEILENPAGERFIAVSAPLRSSAMAPLIPDGWSLEEQPLSADLEVALTGDVEVLRLDNGVSYQGPLGPIE